MSDAFQRSAILRLIVTEADNQIYDLKGSTRNRLIQPTGRVNEVL